MLGRALWEGCAASWRGLVLPFEIPEQDATRAKAMAERGPAQGLFIALEFMGITWASGHQLGLRDWMRRSMRRRGRLLLDPGAGLEQRADGRAAARHTGVGGTVIDQHLAGLVGKAVRV